jgi:hypothetical protein
MVLSVNDGWWDPSMQESIKYIQTHQVAIPVPFASFHSKSFGLTFSWIHSHWKTTANLINAQHYIQSWSSKTEVLNCQSQVYSQATTMTNQNAHLRLASPQSFLSARVPFSTLCSNLSSGLTSWVQSLMVKVQVSSTPKVSCHAFTLLAFESVTSTKPISLPKKALNATAEMRLPADISQHLGTQLIFQLIDASIPNTDKMCSASQLAANEHKGLFNCKTASTFKLIFSFKQ